jgi:hypothetical protein
LYGVLAPVQAIRAYDHLVAHERIASKSPDVEPQAIHIVIHAKRGDIVVHVAADGSVDFPVDEAMHAENPMVETNQPKGSLGLSVTAGLRLPDALQVTWAQIDASLVQADELAAKNGGGAPARRASGVEFRFPPGPVASLTVQGRSERLLKADADGRIVVMRAMIVDSEKPTLQLSRRPDSAVPFEEP